MHLPTVMNLLNILRWRNGMSSEFRPQCDEMITLWKRGEMMQPAPSFSKREVRRILTDPTVPVEDLMAQIHAGPRLTSPLNIPGIPLMNRGDTRQLATARATNYLKRCRGFLSRV